jgi:NarL family two-component system sensor histidine kinase LiaS
MICYAQDEKLMNIFRQLRWKLILNYTIVTVSAFLVVILILGGIVLPRIFVQTNIVNPEGLLRILQKNNGPLMSHILSQSPVDTELINMLLQGSDDQITSFDFVRIGAVQFTVRTMASFRFLVIGADGILLGKTENGFPADYGIGQPFDFEQVQGLEAPLNAALAGETDPSLLYTIFEPNERYVLAIPVFKMTSGGESRVVGVIVVFIDNVPNQTDVPANILNIAARSLLIFLLGIGIMGTIFGAFFARGLSARFKRLSTAIDAWSEGDFSKFIEDTIGDEISQLAQRLNSMAKQLQSLLHRRQEMAISEERNRLARDLHDSAKQMALAASFQLGTALTLYDRDPQVAKKHLVEADALVDSVRNELTNLVHELRPKPVDGQDFSETLKEYVVDWSHRCEIELNMDIEENDELSLGTQEALFRIAQEALANIARHSSASRTDVSLEYETGVVKMIIKDDGHGFDKSVQHGGLGLYSMRERAEALGGCFTVESSPEQGTKIVVTLPQLV